MEIKPPMNIQFNSCLDSVEDNRNKLAITRGPLLYCAKEIDNIPDFMSFVLSENILQSDITLQNTSSGILKNIPQLKIASSKCKNSKIPGDK